MKDFVLNDVFALNMSITEVFRNFFDDGASFAQDAWWKHLEGDKQTL